MKKKILIVEDNELLQMMYSNPSYLGRDFELLQAYTIKEGEALFAKNSREIELIVMDGSLPDGIGDELVRKIRNSGFLGPIITSAGYPAYRDRMMELGCTHQSSKEGVPDLVKEILK